MLKPINFTEANAVYKLGDNPDQNLPAFKDAQSIISCWELEDSDIEQIKETKKMWVRIYAAGQPPICLHVEHPFIPEPANMIQEIEAPQ